jgi:hypothetical protein
MTYTYFLVFNFGATREVVGSELSLVEVQDLYKREREENKDYEEYYTIINNDGEVCCDLCGEPTEGFSVCNYCNFCNSCGGHLPYRGDQDSCRGRCQENW